VNSNTLLKQAPSAKLKIPLGAFFIFFRIKSGLAYSFLYLFKSTNRVMLHSNLVNGFRKKDGTIFPDYNKYCLSNIPSTITKILGGKTERPTIPVNNRTKKVVLLLFDGFGFDQWLQFRHHPFVQKFSEAGDVYPITAVFPSTTAAALTSLNTGLTPQEHGLFEWYIYFKEVDMILSTLPFCSDFEPRRFEKLSPDPKKLFNGQTFYQKLKRQGIKSYVFVQSGFTDGEYSKLLYKGAEIVPYYNFSDLLSGLKKKLEEPGRAYYYVYWHGIDTLSHIHGPDSESISFEKLSLFTCLNVLIENIPDKIAKETTFIVTADHGQIEVDPKKTLYLNRFKWFENSLKKSHVGRTIQPFGSVRDLFVHLKEDEIENVKEKIENLGAKVLLTKDAIKKGYFGLNSPSKKFTERVGDILILPDKNKTFWYKHVKGERFDLLGMHGGLTEKEMIIPFAVANLHELKELLG